MMNTQKIIFKPNEVNLLGKKDHPSQPMPASKHIPDWFVKADRFAKHPLTGEYIKAPKHIAPYAKPGTDDYGKIPTWKACPALLDTFTTGYVLRTPCDIKFYVKDNRVVAEVDKEYEIFIQRRDSMPGFSQPHGYHSNHFAWFGNWQVVVPEGYSVLYTHPLNRYDLPFLSTSGLIDTDKVSMPGSYPFFVRKDWEGVIEAGTPYMQMIPFLRENWESEILQITATEMSIFKFENMKKYRQPDGGVYMREVWEARKYQ